MLLLGIVEFSRVYSLQLRLQQAAREAAREIALHYDDPDDPDLVALKTDTLNSLLSPDIVAGLTESIVYCDTATAEPDAVVTLSDQVELAVPLFGGSTIGTVGVAAKARMPCEG
ncbi:MAG: pilus assembly protein [Actinobacteria bacterium]|nr:pilus assembly protein [Actinomycetota bacterium]